MSIKKLTAENAIIKTASVEVKTLTISGKQVTLAVFRQLPQRSLMTWDGYKPMGLRGVLWGKVNYHPDKCEGEADGHIHVIWQDGNTLYRDCIYENYLVAVAKREPEAFQMVRQYSSYPKPGGRGPVVGLKTRINGHDWDESEECLEAYDELIIDVDQSDQLYIAV